MPGLLWIIPDKSVSSNLKYRSTIMKLLCLYCFYGLNMLQGTAAFSFNEMTKLCLNRYSRHQFSLDLFLFLLIRTFNFNNMLLLSIVWNSISLYPFQLGKELFPNRKCDICTDTDFRVWNICTNPIRNCNKLHIISFMLHKLQNTHIFIYIW